MQSRSALARSYLRACRRDANSFQPQGKVLDPLSKYGRQVNTNSFFRTRQHYQISTSKQRLDRLQWQRKNQKRYLHGSSRAMMPPAATSPAVSSITDNENEDHNVIQFTDDDIQSFSNASMQQILREELRAFENLKEQTTINTKTNVYKDDTQFESKPSESETQFDERPSMVQLLQNFDAQNPPPPDASLEEIQLWLECSAQQESVEKYETMLESAREREDFTSMSMVQRQLLQWYQPMRQRIISEQEDYFSKKKKKGANKYGPFLCTLQPEKLAIITTHEATMHALQMGGNSATLMKMALMIGNAVEAEVNVQRLLRQRMQKKSEYGKKEETAEEITEEADSIKQDTFHEAKQEKGMDWMYGPSHLKRFVEDLNRADPGRKGKVRIERANRRAMQLLESAEPWSTADKVVLGAVLIQMLLEEAKVSFPGKGSLSAFIYEKKWVNDKKLVGHINLNEDFYKMVVEDKFCSLDAYTTRHKPMVVPPKDWVGPYEGGYSLLQTEFMRAHGCQVQKVRGSTLLNCIHVFRRPFLTINASECTGASRFKYRHGWTKCPRKSTLGHQQTNPEGGTKMLGRRYCLGRYTFSHRL